MNAEKNSGADKTEVDMRGTLWNWLRAKHLANRRCAFAASELSDMLYTEA